MVKAWRKFGAAGLGDGNSKEVDLQNLVDQSRTPDRSRRFWLGEYLSPFALAPSFLTRWGHGSF